MANILCPQPLPAKSYVALLALTVCLALGSYFLIEKPLRTIKLNTRSVLWGYGGATVAVGFVSLLMVQTNGLPGRYRQVATVEAEGHLFTKHVCLSSGDFLTVNSFCAPAMQPGKSAVALLGDSHADAVADVLRQYVNAHGESLVQLTHEKCPPTIGWTRLSDVPIDPCRRYNRKALAYVLSRPDIKTIFLTAGWAGVYLPDALSTVAHEDEPHYYANISLGLQQELAALTASGRKVVLMEDVPGLTFDPMWQIRDELIPARQVVERALFDAETTHVGGRSIPRQAVDGSENQLTRQRIEMLPAQFPGLTILDPTKVLCEGDRCMFADSHGPFYADSTHLNSRGSAELLPLISDAHL